ncbi:protein of unknown function [Cyanobium sp. NIES-981]|nr:protein of unknown function [Cyanobium sp. NIES-981]
MFNKLDGGKTYYPLPFRFIEEREQFFTVRSHQLTSQCFLSFAMSFFSTTCIEAKSNQIWALILFA